jgi:hypothetical protein
MFLISAGILFQSFTLWNSKPWTIGLKTGEEVLN